MQYIRYSILFFTIGLFSCLSHGQTLPQLVLKNGQPIPFDSKYIQEISPEAKAKIVRESSEPLKRALNQGVQRLGSLNLQKGIEEFEDVKLYLVIGDAFPVGAGYDSLRLNSVYITETKSIYISEYSVNMMPEITDKLLTHEFLGALGYDDTKYQITSVLNSNKPLEIAKVIASSPERYSANKLRKSPAIKMSTVTKNNRLSSSGGVTVIGGGGNAVLSEAKTFMLDNFDAWKKEFIRIKELPEMKFTLAQGIAVDFSNLNSDSPLFKDYMVFFIQRPIEELTKENGLSNEPVVSYDTLSNAFRVKIGADNQFYILLSASHWNQPILNKSLYESKLGLSTYMHLQLFVGYLSTRFPK